MEQTTTIIKPEDQHNAAYLITKAEVDSQIATAKAFPRDIGEFIRNAKAMATATEEIASSCTYALKRKKQNDKTGQWEDAIIDGPSIRLAEILISCYKNVRGGQRIVGNDGKKITAQGICHDLENNVAVSIEVDRRITGRNGKTFNDDMQIVTGNAAGSIAFRNAVFKVIPGAIVDSIWEAAKEKAKGTVATLAERRNKAINYFKSLGVTEEKILATLNVKSVDEIDLDKLQILAGFHNAIKNEGVKPSEIFDPQPDNSEQTGTETDPNVALVASCETWEDLELLKTNNPGDAELVKMIEEKQKSLK